MIKRINASVRASQMIIAGDRIETSGLVANDSNASISIQTSDVLTQLDELLKLAGVGREKLVRMQIWLSDMKNFEAMNLIYDKWIGGENQPVRACVGAQLANADYLIEIQAWAYYSRQ